MVRYIVMNYTHTLLDWIFKVWLFHKANIMLMIISACMGYSWILCGKYDIELFITILQYVSWFWCMLSFYVKQTISKSRKLLKHPLVTSLVDYKWRNYAAWMNLIFFLIYVVFISFLTAFAITALPPGTSTCEFVLRAYTWMYCCILWSCFRNYSNNLNM